MKRTGEIVLGIIGAVIYGFFGLIGIGMIMLQNYDEFSENVYQELVASNPEVNFPDYETMLETLSFNGTMIAIVSILALIAGIVALVFLKGNKRPKAAGIIFILTGVISALGLLEMALFASVFYIAAGIMCLVRKPKEERLADL